MTFAISYNKIYPQPAFRAHNSESLKIKELVLNSAQKTLDKYPDISIVPAGSWMTNKGFDPKYSDYDMSIIIPGENNSKDESSIYSKYSKIENRFRDVRETLKENITKELEKNNIPKERALNSINVFPPPQIKNCFDSYEQYKNFTGLKMNLGEGKDHDIGLWGVENAVKSHFINDGSYLYKDKNGKTQSFIIQKDPNRCEKLLEKSNVWMVKDSQIYLSDKLKIINQYTNHLKISKNIDERSFFKYTQRINKLINQKTVDDLFLVSNDPKKLKDKNFKERIDFEKKFEENHKELSEALEKIANNNKSIDEDLRTQIIEKLMKFQANSQKILAAPSLKPFKTNT